jgi:hypothetical protein
MLAERTRFPRSFQPRERLKKPPHPDAAIHRTIRLMAKHLEPEKRAKIVARVRRAVALRWLRLFPEHFGEMLHALDHPREQPDEPDEEDFDE